MADTPLLALPMLMAAQAQKHVTVNEALVRLDGLAQLRLLSRSVTTPPSPVTDGEVYAVPTGAVNEWAGQDGLIAIGSNGGWIYATPGEGWRAWVADESAEMIFAGGDWQVQVLSVSPNGAASRMSVVEYDYALSAGASDLTDTPIPANAMVFAVSARVITEITGTLSTWRFGITGNDNWFGSGLGTAVDSYATGILSNPTTVYSDTFPLITGEGGDLSAGTIRVAMHIFEIDLPS